MGGVGVEDGGRRTDVVVAYEAGVGADVDAKGVVLACRVVRVGEPACCSAGNLRVGLPCDAQHLEP